MTHLSVLCHVWLLTFCLIFLVANCADAFRPPAAPLVTHDPYFSAWSMADHLTDDWSKHWTGTTQAMCGLAHIDGKTYRFMGPDATKSPAMIQKALTVLPTRTIYVFEAGGVELTLTFLTPLLPDNLDLVSRPVTYINFSIRALDELSHQVSLYLDCTGEWVVNTADQQVTWSRFKVNGMAVGRMGAQDQRVLARSGDNLRIEWGYIYLALPGAGEDSLVISSDSTARKAFASKGLLPASDDIRMPRAASDNWPVIACKLDIGHVSSSSVSRYVMLAYDDEFSMEYLHRKLRPYWRRAGMDAGMLLQAASKEYASLERKCVKFDQELMKDLTDVGGDKYAQIAALSYRQCLAACKLAVDADGTALMFSKENFSNGCTGTVDVIYPSSPMFLLVNPALLKAQLTPVLDYAASPKWPHPFAPHDLGTYPLANGQVYGGGERTVENQMPVEESGNMLIMLAAIAKSDGNADYVAKYWPLLTKWANYLMKKGLDPENQLCTDDFSGHLAHNTNLSIKAIVAIGAYSLLCDMSGDKKEAAFWRKSAKRMAQEWIKKADDGDHFRLAFDKPGTWSQKYNLVWDRLLGLDLFGAEIAKKEIAFYKTKMNTYGLPLDNRSGYTKLDWCVWTASLAERDADFRAMIAPLYKMADETPSRVPLTDWFWTTDAKKAGFQARSVVGGVYLPMLKDPQVWRKWVDKGK